jgi:hypothetical protein
MGAVNNGLKGKFGENPTRSRHCEWRASYEKPLCIFAWEGVGCDDHEPGDLPIF